MVGPWKGPRVYFTTHRFCGTWDIHVFQSFRLNKLLIRLYVPRLHPQHSASNFEFKISATRLFTKCSTLCSKWCSLTPECVTFCVSVATFSYSKTPSLPIGFPLPFSWSKRKIFSSYWNITEYGHRLSCESKSSFWPPAGISISLIVVGARNYNYSHNWLRSP